MGKRSRGSKPARPATQRQISRWAAERRRRIIFLTAIAAAVGLAVLSLAYGAYAELVAKPNAVLAQVDGTAITRKEYDKYRKFELMRQIQFLTGLGSSSSAYMDQLMQEMRAVANSPVDSSTLSAMVNVLLVKQKAGTLGITLSPDELRAEIREQFAVRTQPTPETTEMATPPALPSPTASATPTVPTPTPTLSPAEIASADASYKLELQNVAQATGMSEDEYIEWVLKPGILRRKIQEKLEAQVPTVADQVHARHILLDAEDAANMAYYMLTDQKYPFDKLAEERSQDSYTKDTGGDLGWFPRGLLGDEFDQVVFSLKPGEISRPFKTASGWEIVQVLETAQARPVDEAVLEQMKGQAFDRWLDAVRKTADIKYFVEVEPSVPMPFVPPASAPTPVPTATPEATATPSERPTPGATATPVPQATSVP